MIVFRGQVSIWHRDITLVTPKQMKDSKHHHPTTWDSNRHHPLYRERSKELRQQIIDRSRLKRQRQNHYHSLHNKVCI